MAETAALLADEVLPERPLRQWVLSLPHALRFLLATDPDALTRVLGVVYRTIWRYLIYKAGLTRVSGATGAVTLVQREKLERLCRYVSRAPVASERLALTSSGHVRYTLKTPYRDGNAPRAGAAGSAGTAGGTGTAVAHAPDQVPRGVRSAQQVARGGVQSGGGRGV